MAVNPISDKIYYSKLKKLSSSWWQGDLRLIYSQHKIHIPIWTDPSFLLEPVAPVVVGDSVANNMRKKFKKWQKFLRRDYEAGEKL